MSVSVVADHVKAAHPELLTAFGIPYVRQAVLSDADAEALVIRSGVNP